MHSSLTKGVECPLSIIPLPTIVAGDLYAKHHNFYNRTNNPYGRSLSSYAATDKDIPVIGSGTPTHLSSSGRALDVLDFVITKNVNELIEVSAVTNLSSHHNPLFITVRDTLASPRLPIAIRRVNWCSYYDKLSRQFLSFRMDFVASLGTT